jgi:hypothetical protein
MSKKNNTSYFKTNEIKKFTFTQEQYIYLEIEFNRYIIYNKLLNTIENILNINENFEYNKRKKYENKNIIERFVLECINHGVSPLINHNNTNIINHNNILNHSNEYDCDNESNTLLSYKYFLFNPILNENNKLSSIFYFTKMINEYNEKKIKISKDIIVKIENELVKANKEFIKINNDFKKMIEKQIINLGKQIECSIKLENDTHFIIKYRNYTKIINSNRYYKLMKNYDKPFPYDIIRMILRYSIFDTSSQQWSIGIDLYEDISELFDISFETFASPLNFNMYRFCSIFKDTDSIFGSVGSFYNLKCENLILQNIKGVFFNPPYLPILMKKCSSQCLSLLDEMNKNKFDFTIFSFLPNWDDADYIQSLIKSKYMVEYKIVNKGNYILQEKDRGKLITGTFDLLVIVLNSNKNKWDEKKKNEMKTNFDTIIKKMKEETKELFYKKK